MLVICDALGTYLSPNGDTFYAGDAWRDANALLKRHGIAPDLDRMWQTEQLFDIPKIDDFPVISHYSKPEIHYLLTGLDKIGLPDTVSEDDEPEEVIEILTGFRDGLRVCREKDVEWVSFLH